MTLKKILATVIAAVMCLSLGMTAFAAPEDESTTEAVTNEEITSEEASSEEATSEENVSEEETSEEPSSEEASSEENSTEEPGKDDVISLIVKLLGQIDFEEVKNTLNDINEALGLPRVEDFTDIPAYADALYKKLDEMGLGYDDIINGIASSDLLDWLNNLLFGGGNKPGSTTTTVVDSESNDSDSGESTPDTGIAVGGTIAAVAALSGSSALAFVLRKRNDEE
ncbi:MAG: hypothetical protein IKC20_02945 [Clostridia bacterium]|nr:hypothetical protein [Clostridia bacterium]